MKIKDWRKLCKIHYISSETENKVAKALSIGEASVTINNTSDVISMSNLGYDFKYNGDKSWTVSLSD